jgi:hypothetical protein
LNEGRITREAGETWLDDLLKRDRLGTFIATITLYVAFGKKSAAV